MRRLFPLLLLATPALCWAASDLDTAPKQGACVYARPSAATTIADADSQQARPATPPAARAAPKPATSGGGGGGGGGSDAETVAPRTRGTRWHSFLPGMFR